MEGYLTTQEAMTKLDVSRPTFDKMVKNGELKRYQQGKNKKRSYYKIEEVDALLEIRSA